MSVTGEELYQQVWAEPMIKVAARYEVCGNYLASVGEYLNVPRPPRGFWAKLSVGKAPERPTLPTARPGEALEWAKGDAVPHPLRSLSSVDAKRSDEAAKPWPAQRHERHELVAGVREFFEAGRHSEVGYLRPLKRNLVDVFERQRWEAECRERERREQRRRCAQAVKESREQLFAIVDAWALADRIERFFDDAERRASALGSGDRAGLLDRIRQARALLGGTDALVRLQQWKVPSER